MDIDNRKPRIICVISNMTRVVAVPRRVSLQDNRSWEVVVERCRQDSMGEATWYRDLDARSIQNILEDAIIKIAGL